LIIGTISDWDQPLDPNQKGQVAVNRSLRGLSQEELQKNRDEILSTSVEDLRAFSSLVKEIMGQGYLCVVGNEKKIEEQKELFKKILSLRQ